VAPDAVLLPRHEHPAAAAVVLAAGRAVARRGARHRVEVGVAGHRAQPGYVDRLARAAIRQAVTSWGLDALSDVAELLASELVANAAEHGSGQPITLALRQQATLGGRPGIVCEVSDTSPALPRPRLVQPDSERGRGLAIVADLATDSGVTAKPDGKTAWFTLTAPTATAQRERQAEAEAGA